MEIVRHAKAGIKSITGFVYKTFYPTDIATLHKNVLLSEDFDELSEEFEINNHPIAVFGYH